MEQGMRQISIAAIAAALIQALALVGSAQTNPALSPTPKPVTLAQLKMISTLEGQLVQISAPVLHTDSAQVFTIGEKKEPHVHVVVPHPAIDGANVADVVAITGFVRRFSGGDFERDYSWFRRADYPNMKGGEWLIVATSVKTPEGTELVPPGVISETSPAGKNP
jgi:hypothetical protein